MAAPAIRKRPSQLIATQTQGGDLHTCLIAVAGEKVFPLRKSMQTCLPLSQHWQGLSLTILRANVYGQSLWPLPQRKHHQATMQ